MTVTPQQLYTFRSSYTTLTYSKDDLREFIAQIEEAFIHSDIYVRALKRLQERLGSTANGLQLLVNALGREAIRLTLRELIGTVSPTPPQALSSSPQKTTDSFTIPPIQHKEHKERGASEALPPTPLPIKRDEQQLTTKPANVIPSSLTSSGITNSGKDSLASPQTGPQVGIAIAIPEQPVLADVVLREDAPVSKDNVIPDKSTTVIPIPLTTNPTIRETSHKPHPQPTNDRESLLSSIGQILYEARCQKDISIEQLHQRTCVPSHHIRALEDGIWHNLPEDIYLKGFIRLLGNAVGLNGHDLSQQLSKQTLNTPNGSQPLSRAAIKVPPSQQPSQIRQTHLYLGYAALMAGATGGLAWMVSQPTNIQESVVQPADNSPPISFLNQHNPHQGSFQVFTNRIFEQINAIAEPETLPPETPSTPIKP